MNRKELAEEIIDFCITYRLLGNPKRIILAKSKVEEELGNICFVEGLIHMIIVKSKYITTIDNKRLKKLLINLEKMRLDLEYQE